MNKIQVKILNPECIKDIHKMAIAGARLTQHSEKIKDINDFMELYNKPVSNEFLNTLYDLPHPTLQKFGIINAVVVGASRRFLQQITRHQNEVKFMSGSLQYSNYGDGDFVMPNEFTDLQKSDYLLSCKKAMNNYNDLIKDNVSTDAAGYILPIGLRNILIISATPYQWKHMIQQRICRRNSSETRYVMLLLWNELYKLSPELFSGESICPSCVYHNCKEGKMTCGKPLRNPYTYEILNKPQEILLKDFNKEVK